MRKEHLYQPFEIISKKVDECPKPDHGHSFFELVFILEGTGRQCINQNTFDYRSNHMFLLTPCDSHSFQVQTTTHFFFLRFNDTYLKLYGLPAGHVQQIEFILQNASHRPGCILKNQVDKSLVRPIVEAILREQAQHDLYNKELITQLINTLIVVVAKNIAKSLPETVGEHTEHKALDILQYVQHHIYEPEKIRAKVISERFGISETYLGRYFKKHTQESLQQYIISYKLKLIEHRLQFSDLRINEIAHSFGFTDESHFNKFFKKNKGVSPVMFRKNMRTTVTG
jgi:AraC-like DNA-binding protein